MWLAMAGATSAMLGGATLAQDQGPHLLFHVSADKNLTAETAGGEAVPNFQSKVAIVPSGKAGGAIEWQDDALDKGAYDHYMLKEIYEQPEALANCLRGRVDRGRALLCARLRRRGIDLGGGLLAVVLWIAASALFALYVSAFSSYNKTYGSLGGVIVFLTWLWITNIIILLGAEFNSEMERSKAIQGGHQPEKEPYLPMRDEPKP